MSQIRAYLKPPENWWLIAVLSGTGYATARLITHRQLDIYAATAEVLLDQGERIGLPKALNGPNQRL